MCGGGVLSESKMGYTEQVNLALRSRRHEHPFMPKWRHRTSHISYRLTLVSNSIMPRLL